jgi:hypothetical protein
VSESNMWLLLLLDYWTTSTGLEQKPALPLP